MIIVGKRTAYVIEAMKEVGIDISKQKSKELTDEMIRDSDKVVNMGCMDKNFGHNMEPKGYRMEFRRPKRKIYRKSQRDKRYNRKKGKGNCCRNYNYCSKIN